jgi:hypothetical protein
MDSTQIKIYGGGSNDSFSKQLCIFTFIGIVVFTRSVFADSGLFTGSGGTRKAGLLRGIETVYDAPQKTHR